MTDGNRLHLNLQLLLPDIEGADKRCIARLVDSLRRLLGITDAKVPGSVTSVRELNRRSEFRSRLSMNCVSIH